MGAGIAPIICAKEAQQYCDITDDRCCTGQGRRISTVNRDKRASLSSGLLASRDAAPATGDGTSSAGTAAPSDTAVKAESRAHILYAKGAASASGFRPEQWSFDAPVAATPSAPAPVSEPPRLVMAFPAKAAVPPAPVVVPAPGAAFGGKLALGVATIVAVTACVTLGVVLVTRAPEKAAPSLAALPAVSSTSSVAVAPPVAPTSSVTATPPVAL